jgi:hypothetical protein
MAPLGDVLYRGIVVEPEEGNAQGEGMVRVRFTPPIAIEPSGTINYIICPANDVTIGWWL